MKTKINRKVEEKTNDREKIEVQEEKKASKNITDEESTEKGAKKNREKGAKEKKEKDAPKREEKDNKEEINNSANSQKDDQKKDEKSNFDTDKRLNIVLFYADDWTMKVLEKLDPNVRTPNIDKMADNGMLFVNNCVTTSVCWISRATLATGLYYSRHLQAFPYSTNMFQTHDWNETLFPRLKNEAGYHTGCFGKWHAPSPKYLMEVAWSEYTMYYGHHWTADFGPWGSKKLEHVTDINRRHAIQFLENRPKDKNFALKVSFFATHPEDNHIPSYNPMNWSRYSYYPDEESHVNYTMIRPSKTATDRHWKELPYFFGDRNGGRQRWRKRWEPGSIWQKNIRDLYAMATEVDWAIGEINAVLKRQGVFNNTLLVFTSDNGDLHGEHGLAEKWYPFEESIKVPLVIQDPRMARKHHGKINTEWTLNVDLAPTLLGAANLEASDFMQGRDIAELYLSEDVEENKDAETRWNIKRYHSKDKKKPWRKDWYYEWNTGDPSNATGHKEKNTIDASFALITNEWKYVYWPQKEYEQLYHRSLDPYDEYDILQNYYIHQYKEKNNIYVDYNERMRMKANFSATKRTPHGDSVNSTTKIFEKLKARFQELKEHVQRGGKV